MELEQRQLSEILETAIVAARLAGQRAMEELGYLKVSIKNNSELVTQADGKCQKIIVDRIKETYPDHGFIGEEGEKGQIFKQSPRGDQIWWVIDPIDGTTNYAHRLLIFSVSIAAFYQGQPIVGVVFDPATDSMFSAVKGQDAMLNDRRINASEDGMDEFSSAAVDSTFDEKSQKWATELMKRTRFRNIGSTALHFAYVAKGSLVAAVPTGVKLWDIAAGALIAQRAGAIVTSHNGENPFPMDLENYTGQELHIFTANKKTHPQILELLK